MIDRNRKGQISAEFIIIFAFVAGGFLLASGVIMNMIIDARGQEEEFALRRIGDIIENEVSLASVVQDNYERYFTLPSTAEGIDYDIKTNPLNPPRSNNSEIVFYIDQSNDNSYRRNVFLHEVEMSSVQKGCNRITKHNSSIRLETAQDDFCK